MSVPVRALVVDDSASNAGLLFEELRRGGFEPALQRVTTREDLEQPLSATARWDVVLSDIAAASLGAFEALALLKERDIDVPFLIVSETLGEETAIRAMKAGRAELHSAREPRAPLPDPRAGAARGPDPPRAAPGAEGAVRERAALPHARRIGARRDPDGGRGRHAALRQPRRRDALRLSRRGADRPAGHLAGSGLPAAPLRRPATTARPRGSPPPGRHADGRVAPARAVLRRAACATARRLTTVFARDLAEHARAEEALRESEERFRRAAHDVERPDPRVRPRDRPHRVVRRHRPDPRLCEAASFRGPSRPGRRPSTRGPAPASSPRSTGTARPASRSSRSTASCAATGRRCTGTTPARFCAGTGGQADALHRHGHRHQRPPPDRGGAAALREALPHALRAEPRRRLPLHARGPHPRLQRVLRPDLRLRVARGGPAQAALGLLPEARGPARPPSPSSWSARA